MNLSRRLRYSVTSPNEVVKLPATLVPVDARLLLVLQAIIRGALVDSDDANRPELLVRRAFCRLDAAWCFTDFNQSYSLYQRLHALVTS